MVKVRARGGLDLLSVVLHNCFASVCTSELGDVRC